MTFIDSPLHRRRFLTTTAVAGAALAAPLVSQEKRSRKAQIAITLDLEMSRHYPRRGMTEWDYQKGNLSEATKKYAVKAARIAKEHGGLIHFFCVGRVLEQPDVKWIKQLAETGHPVGNHTYDHVNVLAKQATQTQFRFQRSPWLVKGKTAAEVIRENIRLTDIALRQRAGIKQRGFRTPGGFHTGLTGRPDIQALLLQLGFKWASCKYPPHLSGEPMKEPTAEVYQSIVDAQKLAQPFVYPSGLIEIPMSPISDVTAFRSKYWKLSYFLKAIGQVVDWTIANGAVFDFLAHPSCLVIEDPNCETIKLICEKVRAAAKRAEIVDLDTIAKRVA